MLFADRTDAGRRLAQSLSHLRGTDVVVLALPRGGVPVASEVARELHAPLDAIVVRKLGVPFQPEYGFGAIGEGGVRTVDDLVVHQARLTRQEVASVEARERVRLDHLLGRLRGGRPPVPLAGRTALVVDDAIATGATARAACMVARAQGARRVIVAVPMGATGAVASLRRDADEVTCLHNVPATCAVGAWYEDFPQVTDAEVAALLGSGLTSASPGDAAPHPAEVLVDADGVQLPGTLGIPPRTAGLVVFVHGSGSSRRSPRHQFVAAGLNRVGFGTLLIDLLTADEERSRGCVFNVALLAARLKAVTRWLRDQPATAAIPVGYFGVSTGTAAALAAATDTPLLPVTAIVSLAGRPDLVGGRLAQVRAPTLLIAGGADKIVLDLNQRARAQLKCESRLAVIPGASYLFEEAGSLGHVTDLAGGWFARHFAQASTIARPRPENRGHRSATARSRSRTTDLQPVSRDHRPCPCGRPGTRLGHKLLPGRVMRMKAAVRDVMSALPVSVRKTTPFREIAARLRGCRVSAFPVLDADGKVTGVVSEADLLAKEAVLGEPGGVGGVLAGFVHHAVRAKAGGVTAADLMTSPAVTIGPDETVENAARLMFTRKVKRLPVVDPDGRLVGIISRTDVLAVFDRADAEIREEIMSEVIKGRSEPSRYQVAVKDGVVTLEGDTETTAIGHDLVRRIRHVQGVVAVHDRLVYPVIAVPSSPGPYF